MKLYISSDIEGTAGIVDWRQVIGPGPEYEMGRRLLLNEINAAIDGATAAGADAIVLNDAHYMMANLPPGELHGNASYISGRHKPDYMMEGLDSSFDAAFFVAYHGSIGSERAALSHTFNPFAIYEVKLNGVVIGESGVNALVAKHYGVPVALVTGDDQAATEAQGILGDVECVVVKRSISRFAAESVHPSVACTLIEDGARRAMESTHELGPPSISPPFELDVAFLTADMAGMATWIPGIVRTGARSVRITGDNALAVYRLFVTAMHLTSALAEGTLK
jgi:D-amino peptidase